MRAALPAPAFGQADLSNCEREQIHLAASIQPHGALLVVRESDQVVVQASLNASSFLNLRDGVLGRSLDAFEGDLAQRVGPHLDQVLDEVAIAIRCHVGNPGAAYDSLLHRPAAGGLVIELERAGPAVDLSTHAEGALQAILAASSLRVLCEETAQIFKALTGYDRVMVYRFDEHGHGEVFAEQREPHLEPYRGNRYPASDIPQIARQLYLRNRVRVLVDVANAPVPLEPRLSPITGQDFDMSLCFLRSMSPIHIQYLQNMGVAATLVVSLVVGGRLWGLVACHHYEARFIHYEMRAVCELLAEAVATRIAALDSFVRAQAEFSVRRLEQRMVEAVARHGDWRSALFDHSRTLLQPLDATGAALLFEQEILSAGEVPGTAQLREIGTWLDTRPRAPVLATASLGVEEPDFAALAPVASGVLATPVSNSPGEYLIWFRPERIRMVTWAGDPLKPVEVGDDPRQLSPRRSFAQWHQLVAGTSDPWSPADLAAARLIGESVADVVIQFRSVRMLIAQDQLAQVSAQVQVSEQPVLIADPHGRILLTNDAFDALLPADLPRPQSITELPGLLEEPSAARRGLDELLEHRVAWREEVTLARGLREPKPLLVRGDPVLSSPDRLLGFMFLFADLSARKAAEAARRRFQEGIVGQHRVMHVRLDSNGDLMYRNLLSSVVGNAQLAALEITDGVDPSRMLEMLDSVRASVSRANRLLEYLIWHAARTQRDD